MQPACTGAQKGTAPTELLHYCQCSVLCWWLPEMISEAIKPTTGSKSHLQKWWKIMFVVTWCQFYVPSFLINFITLFFWSLFSFFILVFPICPVAFQSYSCWAGRGNEIINAICNLNVSVPDHDMLVKHE